ncbi:hypothetical protein G9C98_007254 [Cotesia typhae]|uniref:Rad21/Rec8-like protein N-terminal domain-containing protein n=1 Tax=Cotesia typhae TaxID=2053667 RepID=A0A8J5RB19_9HYME|nr:hypothetical protein G9C98_007254 [Cotesia typhae]
MNFIPEVLKENCGSSITTVWLAGTLSNRMFRQTLNRKQIAAFDISPASREIKEMLKSHGTQRKQKCSYDVILLLVKGVVKLISYKSLIFKGDLKKFEQATLPRIINSRKTNESAEDGDPIDYLTIPDVDVNFSEDLAADTHLLPEDYTHAVQQIKFPEVDYSFGAITSTSDLASLLMTTSLEAGSVRETLGQTVGFSFEDISTPDIAANITMTPTKREKPWEAETPSKRKRKTLSYAFNDVQSETPDEVPVGQPEPEPAQISSLEQESASVVPEPEPPADTSSAQEPEQDTLQKLAELKIDPFKVPKQRRAKKNFKFWDPVTVISGELIQKNQRKNIYTVTHEDVRINNNISRQTTENLFNQPTTSWNKKSFRHPADPARRASEHSAAQLSDKIPAGITNQRQINQSDEIRIDYHIDDHQTDNEQENTKSTVDIHPPKSPPSDPNRETQIIASENYTNDTTLDIAAAGLTPPEPESNESLWSGPKKLSQSHREFENIIDIDDIVSNDSSKNSSSSSWTLTDLKAQIEVYLAERPAVTFEILVPPEDNTKSDAMTCFRFLLSMATKGEITLSQEEGDEDIWITK